VVSLQFLFAFGYDICEHVHHVLVHFGKPMDVEGDNHSPSIFILYCIAFNIKLEGRGGTDQFYLVFHLFVVQVITTNGRIVLIIE
jgi:hypothetical protein